MNSHPYPHFKKALRSLAPTQPEICQLIGKSPRTVTNYLTGRALPPVELVKRFPKLDDALTLDIRGCNNPT